MEVVGFDGFGLVREVEGWFGVLEGGVEGSFGLLVCWLTDFGGNWVCLIFWVLGPVEVRSLSNTVQIFK